MHLVIKNKIRIKYINYFIVYLLILSFLFKVNSNALEVQKNIFLEIKTLKL